MIPISINRLNYYPEILFQYMDQLFNLEMVISSADSIYNTNKLVNIDTVIPYAFRIFDFDNNSISIK